MGVVITREDIIAYAEVDYIINHMNEKYSSMVPESIRTFFATIKEPGYDVDIDPRKPLANQGLRQYTLEIIALLHLKYWCQDEERKQELYNRMKENQLRIEGKISEQYGIDKLFSTENVTTVTSNEDFSKPKVITRYSQIAENNSDVKDYSDVVDEEEVKENAPSVESENNENTNGEQNKANSKNKKENEKISNELTSVKEKENIFTKIKLFVKKIFKKG